jgi:formylmethanofuran dehydrogenase subunit E
MEHDIKKLYEKCVEFHGHSCPGLAIGVRAAVEAAAILEAMFSTDEEIVCISENDACGVDGIQVILGCSVGKGNMIFRIRGKQAFNFYNRKNGKTLRLILKALPQMKDRSEKIEYILTAPFKEVFEQKSVSFALPEDARLFSSYDCEICGESTAEPYIRLQNDKKVCLDCFRPYHRV